MLEQEGCTEQVREHMTTIYHLPNNNYRIKNLITTNDFYMISGGDVTACRFMKYKHICIS